MLNTPEAMAFLEAVDALEHKHNLSETVGPDYYEPGMMENLAQYLGQFNAETGSGKLRVDVKGLRYENRSQRLERVAVGDSVTIARDQDNPYNPNNFEVLDPWEILLEPFRPYCAMPWRQSMIPRSYMFEPLLSVIWSVFVKEAVTRNRAFYLLRSSLKSINK